MKRIWPYIVSSAILYGLAEFFSFYFGDRLAPRPYHIVLKLVELAVSGELFREAGITVFRAFIGIFFANLLGLIFGVGAGFIPSFMRLVTPLVAALQSCPPVVWVSLVLVWAGVGSTVPVAVVFVSGLPFVFSSIAQGVMGLDRRYFAMSALYQVPWRKRLGFFVLPGIAPHWMAAFSTSLAAGWKAAAVAEFLGATQGIGERIYWSYRTLDMTTLGAWALSIIILGVVIECGLVMPLRKRAASMHAGGAIANVAA